MTQTTVFQPLNSTRNRSEATCLPLSSRLVYTRYIPLRGGCTGTTRALPGGKTGCVTRYGRLYEQAFAGYKAALHYRQVRYQDSLTG